MASNRHIHLELEFALHAMEHMADFLIVRIIINSRGWKNCDRCMSGISESLSRFHIALLLFSLRLTQVE
jgi:hypothetical protein